MGHAKQTSKKYAAPYVTVNATTLNASQAGNEEKRRVKASKKRNIDVEITHRKLKGKQ